MSNYINNYFKFLKNPFIQIIIILLIIIIILLTIGISKKNNTTEYFDTKSTTTASSVATTIPGSATKTIPDVIKNNGQPFIPKDEIYTPLRNINMADIVIKYFEYKFNDSQNDPSKVNLGHNVTFNKLNITLQDFISKYLSTIKQIKVPSYNIFLTTVFTSPEINTLLKLDDFNKTFTLYKSVLYTSYFYDDTIFNKIIAIKKNYYDIIFNKYQNNYEELGEFSIQLYEYLHNNINDDVVFKNTIDNSYNFVYNIYHNINIEVPSLNSRDYNTSKDTPKMTYMEIFFKLLNTSPNNDLPQFIDILNTSDYQDHIDKYNIPVENDNDS
jgi:hypothetical protein